MITEYTLRIERSDEGGPNVRYLWKIFRPTEDGVGRRYGKVVSIPRELDDAYGRNVDEVMKQLMHRVLQDTVQGVV